MTLHDAVTLSSTLAGGFDYTQGTGTKAVTQATNVLTSSGLSGELKGTVKATVYPINAEVHFNMFGFPDLGPYISINPYLAVSGSRAVANTEGGLVKGGGKWTGKATAGAQAKVGGDITIFGTTITDVNAVLFDYSKDTETCFDGLLCTPSTSTTKAD